MDTPDGRFSRISKLLVDRDETAIESALERRQRYSVTLCCGEDVARSYTLQLAVLTAAKIAIRCFPGAVRVWVDTALADAPLQLWPSLKWSFGQALASIVGPGAFIDGRTDMHGTSVIFGNTERTGRTLRATFDGWTAKVGPANTVARLPEREYCSLAGVLAGALAISELFLEFAEVSIEAARRTVALSLWRPELPVSDPAALGIPVEFLPRDFWTLGLGHLGNGYIWAVATLPYADPGKVEIFLNDYDKVESDNVETSLLLTQDDIGQYKTRACGNWLEKRGFQTRLIERPFDGNFRRRDDEPGLALCGFDSNPARRDLATAEFLRVVESGLGGTANNFDTISLHTFPNPRPASDLWPDLSAAEISRRVAHQERVARENPAYAQVGGDECGRYDLAGKSIAVPFVGATAATLVVAEAIRLFHRGPAYTDIKLATAALNARAARTSISYGDQDAAGLAYCLTRLP
jgi:hypothetical protein